jgi:tungstate transport system permease protein
VNPTGAQHIAHGLSQGWHLVVTLNPVLVDTTVRTLRLAIEATAIAAVVGVPLGCALGLGRSRSSRVMRGVANGLVRVPPVAVGLLVVIALTPASPWGGGPLADLGWYSSTESAYLAQTLLAIPIMIALTAAAVGSVSPVLLDQARAYGASGPRRGVFAIREARRRMVATVLVTMGVTITAIGALVIANAPLTARVAASGGGYAPQPPTLALGAFQAFTGAGGQGGSDVTTGVQATNLQNPTQALGVAYATVLMGVFLLLAAALTWIQRRRTQWIPGLLS